MTEDKMIEDKMIEDKNKTLYKYTLKCTNGHKWKSNIEKFVKCPQCGEISTLRYPGNWD